jgi:hypothetical protein
MKDRKLGCVDQQQSMAVLSCQTGRMVLVQSELKDSLRQLQLGLETCQVAALLAAAA